MRQGELAPAKVNLCLHVGPRRDDGYHPISSLIVFADVGDRLEAAPADNLTLEIEGPFAADVPAGPDNLVLKAARAMLGEDARWAFRLQKDLPVGAGLGGGSADAAAAIRLLAPHLPHATIAKYDLRGLAASLGSDVPACIAGRPVLAEGRGERLLPAPAMTPTPAVLVHPGEPCPTAAVYRAFDVRGGGETDRPVLPASLASPGDVAAFVKATRNDLEAPAIALVPAVGEVLAVLRAAPEALAARMSGSGSACFAVCPDRDSADTLARRLAQDHPTWWVRACRVGGPWR